jgi:hypothetical protein
MVMGKMRFILFGILICLGVTGHAADNDWPMTPGSSYFPLYRVEKISDRVYTFREGFYRSVFLITQKKAARAKKRRAAMRRKLSLTV